MRNLFLYLAVTGVIGFGFGIAATSSANSAADRIVELRAAQYCAAGITELCK